MKVEALTPEELRAAQDLREMDLSCRAVAVALGYFRGVEMSAAQVRTALKRAERQAGTR
jgi:hypothetical protein